MTKETKMTNKKMIRRAKLFRKFIGFITSFADVVLRKSKTTVGKELFLDTDVGKVRVLTYNMECKDKLPLFVNFHSSGFIFGSAKMDDPFMMNIAVNANVKIFNVDYSLAPESPFPTALKEGYAVVKYAKEHHEELGLDPDKISVGGHSAGGNISAAIHLMDIDKKELGIKCLILDYPPTDLYTDPSERTHPKYSIPAFMSRFFNNCYCIDREKRKNPLISPLLSEDEKLSTFPPTLLITCSLDSLCEEGEELKDKLLKVGVDVTHKRYNAIHGFNAKTGKDAADSWNDMIAHLKRYLWGNN